MNPHHHARPSRSRRPQLPFINHTPFSYIALWLAVLMVVPASIVIGPVSEARADEANGSCQILCVEQGGGYFSCNPDPNDPDCSGGGIVVNPTQPCACQDGTTISADLNTSCDTACASHGGACTLLSCFVPPNDDPIELAHLDFFNGNVAPLRVYAFNPDTNALVFDKFVNSTFPLISLELKAVNEVIADHGLPASDKPLVRTWARDRVRAQILTDFTNIISKETPRTADEQFLYDFATHLVWKKRIEVAQFALDQFRAWDYAVNLAKCDWHSPTKDGIVALVTKPDGSVGNEKISAGCSPGADGTPGNDSTPNVGTVDDVLAGRDDGETCFDLPAADSFVIDGTNETPGYDALTKARCAGVPNQWDVGLSAHPSLEHFLEYGLAISRKHEIITPGFASTAGNTFKEEGFGIGAGVTLVAGVGTWAAVYLAGGWKAYTKFIAPYSGRAVLDVSKTATKTATGISSKAAGALAAGFIVLEVIGNLVTAILTLIDIIEYNNLGPKLKEVMRASYGETETSVTISENYKFKTGKPDLKELIKTDAGKDEIRFALIEAMSPDKDVTGTAPERDPNLFWAQTQANNTPVATPPLNQFLHVSSWDVNKPFEKVVVGLNGGWFVHEVTKDGVVSRTLSLGIDYKSCDGKQFRAWRVADEQFVSMPMGATFADFDVSQTALVDEIHYQSYDQGGGCLTARINHAPTASGLMVTGTQTEGQSLSFTSSGSDPDGDAFSPAWTFGDGGTASGSPVQHTYADNGGYQLKMTAADVYGATGNQTTQPLSIANAPPVIGTITGPTGRVSLNTTIDMSAPFTDAGTADTHAATWDWGDGDVTTGTVQEASGSGTVTGSHAYTKGGSYTVKLKVTDDDTGVAEKTFALTVNKRLSALDPAQIWIGLTNSDDIGLKLDAQAEVLLNNQVVGTGLLTELKGGSSGFKKAVLQSIPLTLSSTPEVGADATLAVRVGVRIPCTGKVTKKSGRVRLWYDGKAIDSGKTADAGSRSTVTLDTDKTTYFLRSGNPLALSTTAGTTKQSIDVPINSNVKCPNRPFTTIGTWSVLIP